ncbi:MAG: hypothetical protein ACOCY1_01205 [Halovenus sp.]
MARTKAVPEPVSMDALEAAHRAVPLVPNPGVDCCRRIQGRGPAQTREDAQNWLAFLEALDLVTETERGYERRHVDLDTEPLAERFRERVYGASELLETLETAPQTVDSAFEATCSFAPTWERNRHTDWERVWRERTRRLLEWAVVFGLGAAENGEYVRT